MQTRSGERAFRNYWLRRLEKKKHLFVNKDKAPRLFWGPEPLLNNKYWSLAMREAGYVSHTVMKEFYSSINKKEDFDIYFGEIQNTFQSVILPRRIQKVHYKLYLLEYLLLNYDIFTFPFTGLIFSQPELRDFEVSVLKMLGKKIVIIPYGGDAYMYSRMRSTTMQQALLFSYPDAAKKEKEIESNVRFWQKHADATIVDLMTDGISRWDVLPCNILVIDHALWQPKINYNDHDGTNGIVNVVHSPNHRGFKGSEFAIEAIRQLQAEGLKINFILLERVQNDEVKRILREEADILIEQLVLGYALSGIEGMASGVAVISNLEIEEYHRILRRYSYLNECPIVSATPETIKERLNVLIRNPKLRRELGIAGRKFTQKYHSNSTAQFVFSNMYDKIWYNKDVDLMNLFHPLKPESFNNKSEKIEHPLIENKIPEQLLKTLSH
ncbi:MAG: aminotransferase [Bacteroidia bacterium]